MTHRFRRLFLVAVVTLSASACNWVLSLDEYAGSAGNVPCSACSASRCECVRTPPSGMRAARVLIPASPSALCPSGFSQSVVIGKGASNTGCECACQSPPVGAACGIAEHDQQKCVGTAVLSPALAGGCVKLGASAASASAQRVSGGGCTPTAVPSEPFVTRALACIDDSPAGDSACGDGEVCAAAADTPFASTPCVITEAGATTSCPTGYGHKYTFESDLKDQRSCDTTACSCSPQPCEGATVNLYSDDACKNCQNCQTGPVSTSNCVSFGNIASLMVLTTGKTTGECASKGTSVSSGSVSADGERTLCCSRPL